MAEETKYIHSVVRKWFIDSELSLYFLKSIYQNTGLDGTDSKMQIKHPGLHLVVTFHGIF